MESFVDEHSVEGDPASLYNLAKSDLDPFSDPLYLKTL